MESIYNTKFISSGDRLEIYKYRGYIRTGGTSKNTEGRRGKKTLTPEEKIANRIKSKFNNLNNARNKIVRIVSCNPDMCTFITLTYAEEMRDIQKSKQQLNKFFQKLRKDFDDLKYLYVLEFQEQRNDVIHYHILTNFPMDHKTSRRATEEQKKYNLDFHNKYWKYGWVDCRNLINEGNTNVGKYISAYLTMDLYKKDLGGMRIYAASRNIERPITTVMETKLSYEELNNIEGYNLNYYSSYGINYNDKSGKDRHNEVNYFDYRLKE